MTERRRPFLPRLLAVLQRGVLWLSYSLHRLTHRGAPSGYVVGMQEIAGLLGAIGDSLEGSLTVNLERNPFYDRSYGIEFPVGNGRLRRSVHRLRRLVVGPWLLGRLAVRYRTFVYVGGQGFLSTAHDGRDHELGFLRRLGREVVCYFTGSEIRSHVLLDAFGAERGIDVITTYQRYVDPRLLTTEADRRRRALAEAADRHAHVIFNATVDQMSYLSRPTEPCLYFFPDDLIRARPEKWQDLSRLVVVHAPSSPVIKGTGLVHAAVRQLTAEGYAFDYVEISNRPHTEVLAILERAHVVLNEFYAFVPGVFGVEGMAANAVVVTSADGDIEPTLAPGANEAWVVTPYWRVYENLKRVLDAPTGLQAQADRGTEWVRRNCSRSADRERLLGLLDDLTA